METKPRKSRVERLNVINTYLVAASGLVASGDMIQAEIRYKQALREAEQAFGLDDDSTIFVISILAAFYRLQNREYDAIDLESRIAAWQAKEVTDAQETGAEKFVKTRRTKKEPAAHREKRTTPKALPPEIRRSLQLLGLSADEPLSYEAVSKAWKQQIVSGLVHPDIGGDVDESIILNNAKDILVSYLDAQAPKLAKQFGKRNSAK